MTTRKDLPARFAIRVLALVLSVSLAGALPGAAHADEGADAAQRAVDDAASALDRAESRMSQLVSECQEIGQEVERLQAQIDEAADQVLEAQQEVIEGREALGRAAAAEYRDGGTAQSLLELVLGASDFSELLRNLSYLQSIADYQTERIAVQQERSERFQSLADDLNARKDAQDAKLADLEVRKAEAERVAADASSRLSQAQGDQAARVAALQAQAEAMAASGAAGEPVEVEGANTVERVEVVPEGTPVAPDPAPVVPDAGSGAGGGAGAGGGSGSDGGGLSGGVAGGGSTGGAEAGWQTGVASAYGGSTDPYTPNPGVTATGAVCDDNSMGVAVPMSWPGYWRYYGRTVEISYNGMTVFATVNDCGYMGGGSRSLDLQPGVWKAFGFSSCTDWGLRTVSYRFM